MQQLILDAGQRMIRHKHRDCRLLYRIGDDGVITVDLLREPPAPDIPVIAIPLEEFRAIQNRYNLRFIPLLPSDELKRRREASLTKYRSTDQYRERRRKSRTGGHEGPLTDADLAAIRESRENELALARRYNLSLHEVADIREGASIGS